MNARQFTPRVSSSGAYRDCKWCRGAGCISCEVEADKEYKRQFPDGPKPMLTLTRNEGESDEALLKRAMGVLGIPDAVVVPLERCPHDTDGDGNCHLCAHHGKGCNYIHELKTPKVKFTP